MALTQGSDHSYLLLLHSDLAQADRLVQLLAASDSARLAIHLDATVDTAEARQHLRQWADMGADIVDQRVPCAWGDISLVDATLRLIDIALDRHDFHHASLLSGSDWPAMPLEQITQELLEDPGDRIEVDPLPKVNWAGGGLDRVQYRHLAGAKEGARYKVDRLGVALQRRLRLDLPDDAVSAAFGRPVAWAGGSQWWTLQRSTLEAFMDHRTARAALRHRLRHAWVPDELYFQTLLRTVRGDSAVTGTLRDSSMTRRYMDFSKPVKPAVLTTEDQVVAAVTSGAFFMRKVTSDSLPALRAAAPSTGLPLPLTV
ncbi:beta-1,6-N-acetylglucosaminyltransferase [Blastococcus sp. SYSU D00813]